MNLNELIAEAEWLITNINKPVTLRAWKALPPLVKVIKNQQRQIDEMVQSLKVISTDWCRNRQIIARLAVKCRTEVAAELEDIK